MDKELRKPYIKAKTLGVCTKGCRLLRKTVIYESKTGLKELNPVFNKRECAETVSCVIPVEELFLGVDFLNDEHTLMDTPITKSPHFGLMKTLSENGDIMQTDYVKRMLRGALDERFEITAYCLDRSYFPTCYQKGVTALQNGAGEEITVYQKNGRYYLHDGKHRAALCALLHKEAKCRVVPAAYAFGDFNAKKIKKLMASNDYQKHHQLFQDIQM